MPIWKAFPDSQFADLTPPLAIPERHEARPVPDEQLLAWLPVFAKGLLAAFDNAPQMRPGRPGQDLARLLERKELRAARSLIQERRAKGELFLLGLNSKAGPGVAGACEARCLANGEQKVLAFDDEAAKSALQAWRALGLSGRRLPHGLCLAEAMAARVGDALAKAIRQEAAAKRALGGVGGGDSIQGPADEAKPFFVEDLEPVARAGSDPWRAMWSFIGFCRAASEEGGRASNVYFPLYELETVANSRSKQSGAELFASVANAALTANEARMLAAVAAEASSEATSGAKTASAATAQEPAAAAAPAPKSVRRL